MSRPSKLNLPLLVGLGIDPLSVVENELGGEGVQRVTVPKDSPHQRKKSGCPGGWVGRGRPANHGGEHEGAVPVVQVTPWAAGPGRVAVTRPMAVGWVDVMWWWDWP